MIGPRTSLPSELRGRVPSPRFTGWGLVVLVPLAWVVSFTALHALTWVEADHCFLAPVLPAVYLLAGQGIDRLRRLRADLAGDRRRV